jgi:glyoxylase-like metal-dependent hydrolase (beta-lactamase superfamily II)
MHRKVLGSGLLLCSVGAVLVAQTAIAPKPPFTAAEAEHGKQIAAKSLEIRAQITNMRDPAEPFKIMGNLYFVGVANGEVYLLTSPQGHILFGAAFPDTIDQIEKNIQAVGFKLSDVKAILLNHNHQDQSGGAFTLKEKSGAQVMAGFAEIPFLEHGGSLPAGTPVANYIPPAVPGKKAPVAGGAGGGGEYPPVKVDRALYDGDVIKVGPLTVTAYLAPGHSPSPTSWLYTVKDAGKEYRVFEFCCWEYPDDLSRNAYINEASVRHTLALFRKVLPVDIYLETGAYGWSGTLNQPSGTIQERMAKLKTDNKLFVNRDIFRDWSAAREVEFEEKLLKLRSSNPVYK